MNENTRSDSKPLRVLAAIRQSKHRKGQTPDTSPELQRKHIAAWAASKGHRVIGESLDLNVSGSKVAPWNRPDLGNWLREKSGEFDAIAVDNLDRAGRDVEAFLNFRSKYLAPLGKSLHIASLDIDLSTPEGETVAINLMAVAQLMAKQHAVKMRDVNASVRGKGMFAGGDAPFGYRVVKLATPGYGYEIDESTAETVRAMADRYLAGNSMRSVAIWLNGQGIPSPRGGRWATEPVRHILTSPAIAGIMTQGNYEPVVDDQGQPVMKNGKQKLRRLDDEPLLSASGEYVMFCDPGIVTVAEWQAIRDLKKANGHSGPRSNGSDLLHVAGCQCGQWLYSAPQTTRGHLYRYLRCSRKIRTEIPGECANLVIRAEHVENALDFAIMSELGDVRMRIKHVIPADDKGKALQFIESQLAGLAEAMINGTMTPELAGRAESGLMAKRDKLIAEAHPEVVEWKDAGITFGQHWQSLDWKGRHDFLVRNGVRAFVVPEIDASLPDAFAAPMLSENMQMLSYAAGRHRVFVWLGDLDALRKGASAA